MKINSVLQSSSAKLPTSELTETPKTSVLNGLQKLEDIALRQADLSWVDHFFSMAAPRRSLKAKTSANGLISVKTEDGYRVDFKGQNQSWIITTPEGSETTIWGDPHVTESDGDEWTFTEKSSFIFGNNKITVETKDLGNGASLSKTVSIYNGLDRITLGDVDIDKPHIIADKRDAKMHDRNLKDGNIYQLNQQKNGGFSWELLSN